MGVKYVEEVNFEDEVAGELPLIVDFYADWCAPCRAISPILEKLAEKYEGNVQVIKVDVQQNKELAMQYKVSAIPYIISILDGKVIASLVGNKPDALEEMFQKFSG